MKFGKRYLFLGVLLTAVLLTVTACDKDKTQKDAPGSEAEAEIKQVKLEFPYELEDGKILVNSLFQSDIENPDAGNAEGEDIASLELINQSDQFLSSAEITVTLTDGTEIPFSVTNIPAGKKVWVYATDNTRIEMNVECEKIECHSEYEDLAPMMEDLVSVAVEDTVVTIMNNSSNSLTDLKVGCHCVLDETYFGGLTYNYPVDEIAPGEIVTIEADDCYLGSAEVVCIKQK